VNAATMPAPQLAMLLAQSAGGEPGECWHATYNRPASTGPRAGMGPGGQLSRQRVARGCAFAPRWSRPRVRAAWT